MMPTSTPPRAPRVPPFPDVPVAFLLTLAAIFMGGLVGFLFLDFGMIAAEGIGTALGIGGVATLAARRVPEPQAARIGLMPLDGRALPLVLSLVPAILLASELDNFAYDAAAAMEQRAARAQAAEPADAPGSGSGSAPAPVNKTVDSPGAEPHDAETASDPTHASEAEVDPRLDPRIDPEDPFSVLEGLVVVVGIAPVVHEFLFRGVLQQGLVAQLGVARGVTLTALLWTMLRPDPSANPARFAAAFVAWFALGWLLGMVRVATGSILGSILLASLWATIGYAGLVLEDHVALPGLNVDGTHLPLALTAASLVLVLWGARRVYALAQLATTAGASDSDVR